MSSKREVAVIVGSLRKAAYSRMMANNLIALAPVSLELAICEIGQLPLYNQDDDDSTPPGSWAAFRQKIRMSDAVLFVTPEYNRSVPAALKNAIDVGSRPRGQNVWNDKPGAIVSVSPGAIGAFGANNHIRQSLMAVNVPTLPHPEAYMGFAATLFDANGMLTSSDTREFLASFMDAFALWIEKTIK